METDKFGECYGLGFWEADSDKDHGEISLLCSALRINTCEREVRGKERSRWAEGCDAVSGKASADPTRSPEAGIPLQSCPALPEEVGPQASVTVCGLLARRKWV